MATRAKLFSQLAKSVDTSGTITSAGISSTVSLGATVYDSAGQLPTSGYNAGDQAFVISTSRLYINSGVGWYNVAVINNTPIVQSVLDSDGGTSPFALATDGTPTTITITAVDSDGDPLTYSSTADSDFGGLATISQADNVFTITPLSQDSATTSSGTITFSITDGINIANSGIQTFTLTFLSPLWDETVLSIGTSSTNSLANSTFIDRSTNTHTVTTSGSPVQTAFHPYLDNWSVEFDGSGSYCYIYDIPTFSVNMSSDFTIEFWINPLDFSVVGGGANRCPLSFADTSITSTSPAFIFGTDGTLSFYPSSFAITTSALELGTWAHVACVRQGSTVTMYLNGSSQGTTTYTNTISSDIVRIGRSISSTGDYSGYISDLRIVDGTALYTNTFTPPTEPLIQVSNTLLLTCQSNRFVDNSTNNYTVSLIGTPKISAYNPFGQGSEYAPGENKGSTYFSNSPYIYSDDAGLAFGTGPFSISMWVYLNTADDNDGIFAWSGQLCASTYQNQWSWGTNGSGNLGFFGSALPNQWYHIAIFRETDSGSMYFYVNGEQVATTTTVLNGTATQLSLALYYSTSFPMHGHMSDVRVNIGASDYSTSSFVVPTAPVGNTNASLYLPMDNAGIYDKTGNHTFSIIGDLATSTTQTKYATTSIDVSAPSTSLRADIVNPIGSDAFTIEGWYYATAAYSGFRTIFSYGSYTDGILMRAGPHISNDPLYFAGSLYNWDPVNNLTTVNDWVHIALTRDASNRVDVWIDGTSVFNATISTSITPAGQLYIGDAVHDTGNQNWYGYIEDFQILKGVAKYTANFTPPTQTQGRTYQAES